VNVDTHFIQHVIYGLIQPVTAAADAMESEAVGFIAPVLPVAAVAVIGGMAIGAVYRAVSWDSVWLSLAVCAAIGGAVMSVGAYNNAIGSLALQLPNDICNALGDAAGGITDGSAFDNVLNQSFAAGAAIWLNIPTLSFAGLAMMIATILFFFATIVTVGAAALIFVASIILLTLLVKIGPLFLACAFMSPTRFAAIGWIKTVAGCVVTQILVVAILTLFTAAETQMVPGIIAQAQAGGAANTVELVLSLCELGFLLFVTYSVTKQAAGLASGIVGGAYQSMASVAGIATSAPAAAYTAAKTAATTGKSMGGSVASSINQRRVAAMIQREIGG